MAETNGISEIRIAGKVYPLLFGRAAAQEMATRSIENLTGNPVKLFLDLIYSGMMNNAIKEETKFPQFSEVYELLELFPDEEDATEQQAQIWECFQSSRFGAEWAQKIEESKKKVEEILNEIESKKV